MLRVTPILSAQAALALWVATAKAYTADIRSWVTITNCQYVADKNNDGDSFRVREGTNEFRFRLYYVDAPETNLTYPERLREQAEHYGITLDEALKAGSNARERVRHLLREPFTVQTRWASAAGRARETRYYAIVEAEGRNLGEILVSEGLAQTRGIAPNLPSGEKAMAYVKRLEQLEADARRKRVGAWTNGAAERKEAGEQ